MICCLNITNFGYLVSYESERRMYFIADENTVFLQELFMSSFLSPEKSPKSVCGSSAIPTCSTNSFFTHLPFKYSQYVSTHVLKSKPLHSFSIAGLPTI